MAVIHEPSSLRVRQKRERRVEELLDAAAGVLELHGLEGLTLARVAEAMGWVPAALYRYVGSKDGLLAMMQRRAISETHQSFRAAQAALPLPLDDARQGVLAALLAGARFYLDLPRTHPQAWLLIAILLGDPRPLLSDEESQRTAPLLLAFLSEVRVLFEQAATSRALSDGDAMARTLAFWATLQGALSLEKARRIAPALPSAADVGLASAQAMLLGWGASHADVAAATELTAANRHRQALSKRTSPPPTPTKKRIRT